MQDINRYKVVKAPADIYYIPNFITAEEEDDILKNVYSAPKPKWTYLSNRRLQDYGGIPHEKGMVPEKIPLWLSRYIEKISTLNVFGDKKPNQVLVNEYLPGQGIMPHTDGPLFYPMITTISCGSHTILNFLENDEKRRKVCDVLLERRSLVVIQCDMYSRYLHSIEKNKSDILGGDCINLDLCSAHYKVGDILDRTSRISVTIRNVPKILKIKLWN